MSGYVLASLANAAHLVADLDVPAPETMTGAFAALGEAGVLPPALTDRRRASVGFRNVAVHTNQSIDWAVVYRISHNLLGDFRAFAQALLNATKEER